MLQALRLQPARVLTRDGKFVDLPEGGASRDSVPLTDYLAQPAAATGVSLVATDDVRSLTPHLAELHLITVNFDKLGDGRGYSIAAVLRRNGYRGDLRATGDVLVDQLHMLRRVGFSSFELRADQPEDLARAALRRHSDAYQAAADEALPAYRRAPRAGAVA